jgi:hypothetical protein
MAATEADGSGDPFSVRLTPGMVSSGVPLTVYMISVTDSLDPMIARIDADFNYINDANGDPYYCDDAGDTGLCWGNSVSLTGSFVTRRNTGRLGGFGADAMLSIPLDGITLDPDPDLRFFNYLMTSYQQSTFGDYVLAFHVGTGGKSDKGQGGTKPTIPTPTPPGTNNNNNAGIPEGFAVTCDNGSSFNNGVEILINQMRAGFTYTATVIGMNGFDPVLAVLDENGRGLCTDDSTEASNYSVDLPTSGFVGASNTSAQISFSQTTGRSMADTSLVVGSVGSTAGEFILILEGMAATDADGQGDPFSVRLTPGMINSGVPLTVYMISVTDSLDPLIARIDADYNFVEDDNGDPYYCDDAGDAGLCWGESVPLNNSYVTRRGNERLGGFGADAMLSIPLDGLILNSDPDFNFYNYVMTSYQQSTFGDYVLAFHIGMSGASVGDV